MPGLVYRNLTLLGYILFWYSYIYSVNIYQLQEYIFKNVYFSFCWKKSMKEGFIALAEGCYFIVYN